MTESLNDQDSTTTQVTTGVAAPTATLDVPTVNTNPTEAAVAPVENAAVSAKAPAEPHKNRLQKVGKVVSDKMNKTIVVEVEYLKKHRLYKKSMRRTSRFKAHDEQNVCKMGDLVRIEESRPFSKEKTWRLVEVIQKGVQL